MTKVVHKWQWLVPALIIMAGKLVWWGCLGTIYENDSLGYLRLEAGLFHPPGYNAFCASLLALVPSLHVIVLAQMILFSLSAGWTVSKLVRSKNALLVCAFLLALDPCTGLLCADVMSETFYLSLILPCFPLIVGLPEADRKTFRNHLLAIGLLLSFAWLTRYAALFLFLALVIWLLFSRMKSAKKWMAILVLVLLPQLFLIPLRMYYKNEFGTWKTSGYAGLSLWNASASLYPSSGIRKNPGTPFEEWLATYPDSVFSLDRSLNTSHIFSDELPAGGWVKKNNFDTKGFFEFSSQAGATARRLMFEQPFRYVSTFGWRNFLKPWRVSEEVVTTDVDPVISERYGISKPNHAVYHRHWWWVYSLCFLILILEWFRRRNLPGAYGLLVLFLVISWFVTWATGAVFLRYMYFMAPLILIALSLLIEKVILKWKGES